MSEESLPKSEIILYQTDDGSTRIQCRLDAETLWLTQAQIVELFQVTPQNVTHHLKAVFAEGELSEAATCKDYLQVRTEGGGRSRGGSGTTGRRAFWRLVTAFTATVAPSFVLRKLPRPRRPKPPKP